MRGWFRHAPLPKKLTVLIASVALLTITVVATAFSVAEVFAVRYHASQYVLGLHRALSFNVAAGLAFNDRGAVTNNLETLANIEDIAALAVYDGEGRLFAQYRSSGAPALPARRSELEEPAVGFLPYDAFHYAAPVLLEGQEVGSLYIRAEPTALEKRLKRFFAIAAAAITLALMLTAVMVRVVQRVISKPIVNLAEIVDRVAREGDYAVRAQPARSRDEVGTLVDGVNHMLAQIEQNKGHLEQRVAERTAELEEARAAAEAASLAKTRFLAQVSHELRTPLNRIQGLSALLLRTPLSEDQRRRLEHMQAAGQGFVTLIEDLLDVSRIESGRPLEIRSLPFAPRRLAAEICDFLRPEAQPQRLGLLWEADPGVPAGVLGDVDRVRQILMNLVNNALKFTSEGEVRIRLQVGEGGRTLGWAVIDTGVGIPSGELERVLQPFEQLADGSRELPRGLGLGLPISRDLARQMGGDLQVTSEPGQGTTVVLELPLSAADEAVPEPSAPVVDLRITGPAPRVLVVEDDTGNREVTGDLLEGFGCRVDLASAGHEALEMWERNTYDLVLMDYQMPGLDGLEAAAQIRAREGREGRARTPIVAATAYTTEADREKCLAAGMDDYLVKPFTVGDLASVVAKWTGREVRFGPEGLADAGHGRAVEPEVHPQAIERLRYLASYRGAETAARALAGFRESAAALLEELQRALGDRNLPAVHRTAHSLKSTAGNLGIVELQDLCRRIELAAKDGSLPAPEVVAFREELARIWEEARGAVDRLEGLWR